MKRRGNMYCESYQTYKFRKLGVSNPRDGICIQESRMRENLTYGLMRGQGKQVDATLERDTRPKGEKQLSLTMSVQRCALVLLYRIL